MKEMTLTELADSTKEFFTADEIAGVLGSNPQTIRTAAKQKPELLGFPSVVIGNRVKFPRIPFLRHMGINV